MKALLRWSKLIYWSIPELVNTILQVQRKAQEEIDRIVGSERLPTMDDEPKLQYIRGCVKESLHWMPTTILGAVPHAATQDDTYMGYLIPKGAGIMNNAYTINMDPKRFPARIPARKVQRRFPVSSRIS